jgi:DNA-directed RNA polymerase sigma subunit (sigma70/sigma32)
MEKKKIGLKLNLHEAVNRTLAIGRLYLKGESLAAIGRRYGLSRERVRQIIKGLKGA